MISFLGGKTEGCFYVMFYHAKTRSCVSTVVILNINYELHFRKSLECQCHNYMQIVNILPASIVEVFQQIILSLGIGFL